LLQSKADALEQERLNTEEDILNVQRENINLKSEIEFLKKKSVSGGEIKSDSDKVYDGLKDAAKLNNKVAKEMDLAVSERAVAYNRICKTKLSTEDAESRIQLYISLSQPTEDQLKEIYGLKSNELNKIGEIINDKQFEKHLCNMKFKAEKTNILGPIVE
jgi:hypothetical protein